MTRRPRCHHLRRHSPSVIVRELTEASRIAHSARLEVALLPRLLRTNGTICQHCVSLKRDVEDEPSAIALPFIVRAPLAERSETSETAAVPFVALLQEIAAVAATLAKSLSTPTTIFACIDPNEQALIAHSKPQRCPSCAASRQRICVSPE